MYIQIKTMDGKRTQTLSVSRCTPVPEVKKLIETNLAIDHSKQKLYYKGKQLEDDYTLFEYGVKLNDVIQVVEMSAMLPPASPQPSKEVAKTSEPETPSVNMKELTQCKYYKVGDMVDCRDLAYGGWFEAEVLKIENPVDNENPMIDSKLVYSVRFTASGADGDAVACSWDDIRPIARETLTFSDLAVGDTIMVNYNMESPKQQGYWYDMTITALPGGKKGNTVVGSLIFGRERAKVDNTSVNLNYGAMRIEKPTLLADRTDDLYTQDIPKRSVQPECDRCNDNPRRKCTECSCKVCGGKDDPDKQIMCDECDGCYHIGCLDPPLTQIPAEDDWYCSECKNDASEIVKAGEKLKESKRRSKMPSSQSKPGSRDWGHGMATVGRTTQCTIVQSNHFGEIPGIDVGTTWKFRMQVSESGVHRPPVGGIHGRERDGAYSIVLSGGYEDDLDNGEEFFYTGSGGRDLSGNKRTSCQSCDQELTNFNKAIAVNCKAPLSEKGADAGDKWRAGKPIRVVRNYKLAKHSEYAPTEGNRYDGLYKVVRYFPETGKSGFRVWRYVLRRDDPSPAPWTKAGKKRSAQLGLEMIYPEGYAESQAAKEMEKAVSTKSKKTLTPKKTKTPVESVSENQSPNAKRRKLSAYQLPSELTAMMEEDVNVKLWQTCRLTLAEGKTKFLATVTDSFMCICCQELVHQPVTTDCLHNICTDCLKRSFKAEMYGCPNCRNDLGKDYKCEVNPVLNKILLALFPGYEVGR